MGGRERERERERERKGEKKPRKPGLLPPPLLLLLLGQTAVQPDSSVAIKRLWLHNIVFTYAVCCTGCSKARHKHSTRIHKSSLIYADRRETFDMQQRQTHTSSYTMQVCVCVCVRVCVCLWASQAGMGSGILRSARVGKEIPQSGAIPNSALLSFSFRGKSLLPACFCSRPQKICGSQH